MRIHHLDCCTMCPFGGSFLWGRPGHLVSHVLAIETARDGIVLVDTGVGAADLAHPVPRLGPMALVSGLVRDPTRTAAAQLRARGLDPGDVRHIALTHFDLDHAGGIGDFPNATVHLLRSEMEAALAPPTFAERQRYRRAHVEAVTRWEPYDGVGEAWRGFGAAQRLRELHDDLLLVPLIGHTRGHAAVAVPDGDRWLLHCGDAYFRRASIVGEAPPRLLRWFERAAAWDRARVEANHARLAEAVADPSMTLFCAHDADELAAHRGAAAG